MPITEVWLMRHGHIVQPKQKSFIGQSDLPLSKLGREQIRGWQSFSATQNLDAVLCSPLQRCQESAQILCPQGIVIITEPALREIHLGTWEGQSIAHIKEQFPQEYAARGKNMGSFRPPQGESFEDVAQRVLPAMEHYLHIYAGKKLLVMAHAGVNRVILAHYLHLPLQDTLSIPQPYGCCTHLLYDSLDGCSIVL